MSGLILKEVGKALAAPTALTGGQVRFETRIMGGDIQGSSGYYPKSVIERDGPKVFHKGLHMHIDHQSFMEFWDNPAGSLNDLAAVIDSTPRWEENHPDGAGLYAEVKVFEKYAPFLKEIAPYIGVSIRAAATSEEGPSPETGEMTEIITELIAAVSVDFVTHPGADGRIVKILESNKRLLPEGSKLITHKDVPAIEAGTPATKESKPMAELTEETAKGLETALTGLIAVMTQEADARKSAADTAAAEVAAAAEIDIPAVIEESAGLLADSGLPAKARARVMKAVKAGDTIKEAITAEQEYLAEVAAENKGTSFTVHSTGSTGGSDADKNPWATEAVGHPKGVLDYVSRMTGKVAS